MKDFFTPAASKDKSIFLIGRAAVAALRWSFAPRDMFKVPSGRVPAAWEPYVASGALEVIPNPGSGFDPVVVSDRWFEDEPAEPTREATIGLPEVLALLNCGLEDFRTLRARYGAPRPAEFVGGPSADLPDRESEPKWLRSELLRWVAENPILAKVASDVR